MKSIKMTTRRHFIIEMAILCSGLPGRILADVPLDSVALSTAVPKLLFFPQCNQRLESTPQYCQKTLTVTALQLNSSTVTVHFSNSRIIEFPADQTFNSAIKQHKLREGILIKSLSAYLIDALYRFIRPKTISFYSRVKLNFIKFQEQPVLEALTLRTVYQLVRSATEIQQIKNVTWDPEKAQFHVV